MNIAIDITPLEDDSLLSHRVRGTGFYIENLKSSLLKYYPENKYIFFVRGEKLPENIDLVHYPYFEPFFLTLPFNKSHRTVVTVHDLTPLVFPKNFPVGIKGAIKWQIQKRVLKRVNGIITDSECSKTDIIKFVGILDEKVHVVYLAAGDRFRKIRNSKFEIRNLIYKYNLPEKFVLYVGDVTWNKNLPRLVDAIKKINLTLVMVGSALVQKEFDSANPWNQDLLRVQKSIEGDKRFIRLGFVSTEDLVSLYNSATVFVMPSLYEGFGLPVLEAIACRCPVVTTRAGSLSEVASDAAFYVDAYDSSSIANGLGEVYFNKGLQDKLCQKGLMQAKKFSWEKTARETLRVYEKILAAK